MVRVLDLLSGGPGFNSSSLDGFVFGGSKFNSSTLCKSPTGQPPASFLQVSLPFSILVLFICSVLN